MCKTCGCKDAETLEGEDCGCKHENEAESFGAEEWDFGNDREALRKSDENSDFNSAWRMVFRTKRRGWPSWGQKFYDKYKWTLDDSTWNPYVKGGDLEDEDEPKGFREAESFEAHDHSHIYPSEELTPSHSHSSETFKSSNNNTNTMAAESKFDKLSDKIAKQYRKKGMSAKEAKEIGNKTAYTIGRKKYGKAGMAKKARAGMRAESFEAQGNPDKTTTSINPKFFVGKGDGDDLRGKGKFMKYNDALAKAQEVAEKEGKSRVVNNRGFALWTHDGQGLFQKGKSTTQAKKYYRAEEYSIGSGFRLGFGLGLGMLALSTVTTIAALAASTIDERQVEK